MYYVTIYNTAVVISALKNKKKKYNNNVKIMKIILWLWLNKRIKWYG